MKIYLKDYFNGTSYYCKERQINKTLQGQLRKIKDRINNMRYLTTYTSNIFKYI